MANMGYCRFENTSRDLSDCVEALEDIHTLDELSESEQMSASYMLGLCERYVEFYNELREIQEDEREAAQKQLDKFHSLNSK